MKLVVPGEGLEPSRPCGQRILNPSRLPIPPPGQGTVDGSLPATEAATDPYSPILVLSDYRS